jgi:DNA repair protein SbcD/Mre11
LEGAIIRLTVDYIREWDNLIDEPALRRYAESAFEFHLIKHPQIEARIRLPANQAVSSLSPLELLDQYWRTGHGEENEADTLQKMAQEIIEEE